MNGQHVAIQRNWTNYRVIDDFAFSAVVANASVAPDLTELCAGRAEVLHHGGEVVIWRGQSRKVARTCSPGSGSWFVIVVQSVLV